MKSENEITGQKIYTEPHEWTCGNCKHWERNKPNQNPIYDVDMGELDTQKTLFGACDIRFSEIGFHDDLKGNEIIIHTDLYSFETGENFGCINFERK